MAEQRKRECGERVGTGVVTFPCNLEKDHDGPCSAIENSGSQAKRRQWQREQDDAALKATAARAAEAKAQAAAEQAQPAADLSEFQGKPATFWDAMGEGEGTPHPGVEQISESAPEPVSRLDLTPEPTKQRPGDQPLPVVNGHRAIQRLVIDDIEARIHVGIERYGTPLQPFNGRDAALDAYEEALDLSVYLRQVRYEHSVIAGRLRELAQNLEGQNLSDPRPIQELFGMADVLAPPPQGG